MSTRSTIAIENTDGAVSAIYCHFDGYLDGNGTILINNYQNLEKIKELISLGDISSLDENIGSKHDFNARPKDECNFYHRDREENWDDVKPKEFSSRAEYMHNFQEEYNYLFFNGEWLVSSYKSSFEKLTKELIESY